jgi:hypothetical protein
MRRGWSAFAANPSGLRGRARAKTFADDMTVDP